MPIGDTPRDAGNHGAPAAGVADGRADRVGIDPGVHPKRDRFEVRRRTQPHRQLIDAPGHLAAARGLVAPLDYGLAGYDNIADELAGQPAELTSIGFPRERMGALALRAARELCDEPTQEQQHLIVAPELHVRRSTMRAAL